MTLRQTCRQQPQAFIYGVKSRLSGISKSAAYRYGSNALSLHVKNQPYPEHGRVYGYGQTNHLIGEYDNNGARQAEHIWLGDLPVAMLAGGSAIYPVLSDHLGTPRQIIDGSKQVRWQWDNLDPFGANAPNTNPAGVGGFGYNLRFPGQYADNESGLFYNYHRTYDPKAGRYTQSDPIGLDGGMNTYGYVGGNPVNQIDPYGLTAEGAVLGGTIGGGAAIVGSIAIDVTTGGANILATPSEIAFATAAGAAFGDVVSDFVNNVSSALENAYEMAKGGNQNVRDSGLEGYTDQEIQDLYDKAKGKDKKRLEKELKGRKVKNKNKRCP